MATPIEQQLTAVRQRIAIAEARSGRPAGSVRLVAVSKTFPVDAIAQAYAAGQREFGENRLQELLSKKPSLPPDCRWHLIGPLQRNKVRKALSTAPTLIHAVENSATAHAISRIATELDIAPAEILLEVNIGAEATKHGFLPAELERAWDTIARLPGIRIQGFMCVPPIVEKPELARPYFAKLRSLAEKLREGCDLPLPFLSMGMSGDFEEAILEGATHVRVGSAIFGTRAYPKVV